MSVSRDEIKQIANLARIELNANEVEKFQLEVSEIIDYNAKQLGDLTKEVEGVFEGVSKLVSNDEPRPSLGQDIALANAKESENGFVVVPRILGEG